MKRTTGAQQHHGPCLSGVRAQLPEFVILLLVAVGGRPVPARTLARAHEAPACATRLGCPFAPPTPLIPSSGIRGAWARPTAHPSLRRRRCGRVRATPSPCLSLVDGAQRVVRKEWLPRVGTPCIQVLEQVVHEPLLHQAFRLHVLSVVPADDQRRATEGAGRPCRRTVSRGSRCLVCLPLSIRAGEQAAKANNNPHNPPAPHDVVQMNVDLRLPGVVEPEVPGLLRRARQAGVHRQGLGVEPRARHCIPPGRGRRTPGRAGRPHRPRPRPPLSSTPQISRRHSRIQERIHCATCLRAQADARAREEVRCPGAVRTAGGAGAPHVCGGAGVMAAAARRALRPRVPKWAVV